MRGDIERLTGWDPSTFAGRIYSIVHPEDQRVLFALSRRMRSGQPRTEEYELRIVGPDGTYRPFHCVTQSRLNDPAHGDLITVLEPIGEPVVLTDRHTGLLAAADDLVIIQDRHRHTEYVGPSVERLLGYTADALVEHWVDILHPDDIATFQQARDEAAAQPDGTARVRLRGWHADGRMRIFDMAIVNRYEDGVIDGLLLSGRDVTEQVEAEERLHAAEARFQALVDNNPDIALLLDGDGVIEFCSAAVTEVLGYSSEAVVGTNVLDYVHPDDQTIAIRELAALVADERTPDRALRVRRKDGSWVWIEAKGADRTDVPALRAMVLTLRDISDRIETEQRMRRLTEVLEGTTDMVCIFDRDLELIWANTSATAVLGPDRRGFAEQAPAWARAVIERDVLGGLRAEGSWRGELAMTGVDGREIPTEATVLTHRGTGGQIEFISAISRDMSDRKALEARLNERARLDPLTGLPNRTRLTEQLEELAAADRPFAVAFLDLDQFKTVNDTLGHDVGDQLLVAFASRLRTALRPEDHVARFGGDEFVLVLVDVESGDRAVELVSRVLRSVRGNLRLAGAETFITASAGVAVHDDVRLPADPATMISDADAAMYEAKSRGRDQVVRFTGEFRTRTVQRHETSQRLRRAIADDEIDVWFQPIIDTTTGQPRSLEALARWDHPVLGMVPPTTFVSVAEETGLIVELGASILDKACARIAGLGDDASAYTFSVNLSPHQLLDPGLPEVVGTTLGRHGLSGRQLVCEMTESAVMQDVGAVLKVLDELRLLGCTIAIDDFGTGYSSLAYLHRFPVDVLKIDREFIAGLSFQIEWDRSLVAGIVSLGHSLGMRIVAEGVETIEQADILAMLQCDAMQGYLFSRPTPAASLPDVLAMFDARDDR